MLTISQLAKHAGCTVKAVRVYHARGLLPEPGRDASGYRRYGAQDVIDLSRIVTLSKAGVPLADIPAMLAAGDEEHREAVERIDADLAARIDELRHRRAQLTLLRTPDRLCLPEIATGLLDRLRGLGFSERYVNIERDTWILATAVMPAIIDEYLPTKLALLDDEEYVRVLRIYDEALDWAPDDPRIDELARATLIEGMRVTMPGDTAAIRELPPEIVDIVTAYQSDAPAWQALDERTRRLAEEYRTGRTTG
ncbi:helix-turn-helix domain-containing protein [Amycolatopsis magusensis]|uniref:helix-turn-helix domain-containing protein n=1 Tax=Amycolatopsis magusensis TaxID=882444 RepID=UPI00379126A5